MHKFEATGFVADVTKSVPTPENIAAAVESHSAQRPPFFSTTL